MGNNKSFDADLEINRAIEVAAFKKELNQRQEYLNLRLNLLIQEEIDWLKKEARKLIQEKEDLNQIIKQSRTMHEWGNLEILLRQNKHSFSIDWYHNRFMKINGVWKVFKTRMKFNKSLLIFSFKRASKTKRWELKQANELEAKFRFIRIRIQKLIVLKRYT